MVRSGIHGAVAGTAAVAGAIAAAMLAVPGWAMNDFTRVERGRYLVAAGDCQPCHTPQGGKPFQGGRAVPTPFGTIYSANITPDRETGIGGWTEDQFYRAVHEGIARDGSRLYPAFPYPYYTHVSRADVDDIYAYLQTLEPVRNTPPGNALPFPVNQRWAMRAWNWMFFKDAAFTPDPRQSPEWNRGAYLVEGLGHCAACHTPKNFLGADTGPGYQGANLQDWVAPDLGPDLRQGLGRWSTADVFEYLRTGRNRFSNSTGPMAEVIEYSTSQLTDGDLQAIAVYLKDLPNREPSNGGADAASDPATMNAGAAIFADQCAECHGADGAGEPRFFPALKDDPNIQQNDPATVIRVLLEGARSTPTAERPTPLAMPAFNWKLTDDQIAAVATYVRNAWGNAAPAATPGEVAKLRGSVQSQTGD